MECKVIWLNIIKEKELREEEELRTKCLRREIATMKTEKMELWGRIAARTEAHNEETQCTNELTASLAEHTKKHKLRDQLKTVEEQLETSRTRAKLAELAFRQLKEETTDSLRLRIERCLRGFVELEVQTLKWMKLDSLERRLMGLKTNRTVRHRQLIRLVNSFSSRLEEARKNLELDILVVLRSLGEDGSSTDAVTVASDESPPDGGSP
ncbi:hypothetical protein AXG93_2035s1270 [Marchantia polymorpha subsp. ruderalis]|uniref:Uncharacterized protein n=1 Tax=Marchantia polymorpha subsp. ruderalis TaxID=1480154 RepID=A0A176VRS4_MARPO|nr:hypothetical protein AXG93_2035s1270 [Marchantia polymorpha subsp. ruderalis]